MVEDGVRILSNAVVSQIDIFAAYGGVIPEVAARSHLEAMMPVVDKALADAGCDWRDIDAIAVTYAPGLLGSLLIGTLTARMLAILHGKPLYAVHHLKAHVYANWVKEGSEQTLARERFVTPRSAEAGALETRLSRERLSRPSLRGDCAPYAVVTAYAPEKECPQECPQFPILAMVVSGGHTQILYMPGHNRFEIIGTTRDDAVGECFDKVAKILGLPYPGGPAIAAAAAGRVKLANGEEFEVEPGDAEKYQLPHPKIEGLDFSFSGLKTAVLRAVQKAVEKPISFPSHELAGLLEPQQVADFAASFQKTAVEILVEKLRAALKEHPEVKSVVLAGGVAANEELRRAAEKAFSGLPVYFPALKLSGDNGAMVAAAAYYEIQTGVEPADPYKLNIYPRISIET